MNTPTYELRRKNIILSAILDIAALAFIYLIPTFSHVMNLPVYFIEPMRLMLVLALAHTDKRNAYILALTLPLFSFLISAHPVLPKMFLIAFELALNVFLFYFLKSRLKKVFPSILFSIVLSKAAYYAIKFLLIQWAVISSGLISTPLLIQLITTAAFSFYMYLFFHETQA